MGKCHNCDQYNYTTHSCPVFCDVIRNTLDDIKADERNKIINKFDSICEEARSHKFGVCDADFVIDVIKAKVKEQLK